MLDLSSSVLGGNSGHPLICTSVACREAAKNIINDMDLNIDPCTDFYQYACGNWIKTNELPADRSDTSTLSNIHYGNQEILHGILNSTYDDLLKRVKNGTESLLMEQDIDQSNFNKAKDYFDACMDEKH
ncbi:unnamed protein product [Absidia cylindrospora]